MGSKDDPAELGYTVAVAGVAALEQVIARCMAHGDPVAWEDAPRGLHGLHGHRMVCRNALKAQRPCCMVPLTSCARKSLSSLTQACMGLRIHGVAQGVIGTCLPACEAYEIVG